MSPYLRFAGSKCLTQDIIDWLDVNKTWKGNPELLILRVDPEYHKELHGNNKCLFISYPKNGIKENMSSNYGRKLANEHNISVGGFKNLVPTLNK